MGVCVVMYDIGIWYDRLWDMDCLLSDKDG